MTASCSNLQHERGRWQVEAKGSVALGEGEMRMRCTGKRKRMCGRAQWSLRYYMVPGEETQKNKGKTMHCKTEGVKAEEICVKFMWIISFIQILYKNKFCLYSLSQKVLDQLSMSYHWLRQGFERSRFCSGKHKEIIAKSHPNQPDGCKCKLGFLKYPIQRSTSLHCDIGTSAFSVLKKKCVF